MKIYVTHSTSFDYKTELYSSLRASQLNINNEIILPHEKSDEPYNSVEFIKTCDLLLAEVSFPSTGQGIELGIAYIFKVPILCLYRKGMKPSSSLSVITKKILEYRDAHEMIRCIEKIMNESLFHITS